MPRANHCQRQSMYSESEPTNSDWKLCEVTHSPSTGSAQTQLGGCKRRPALLRKPRAQVAWSRYLQAEGPRRVFQLFTASWAQAWAFCSHLCRTELPRAGRVILLLKLSLNHTGPEGCGSGIWLCLQRLVSGDQVPSLKKTGRGSLKAYR